MEFGKGWFVEIGRASERNDLDLDLMAKVRETLLDSKGSTGANLEGRFTNVTGLGYVLESNWGQLRNKREDLKKGMEALMGLDLESPDLNAEATLCHLRPLGNLPLETCPVCRVDGLFDLYEAKLFNFNPDQKHLFGRRGLMSITEMRQGTTVMAQADEDVRLYGKLRAGTWQDSPLQQALKSVYQFANARLRFFDKESVEHGKKHLELFEIFKKEFRAWRAVWMAIRDHVSLRDEVCMATERLRFFTKEERMAQKREGENFTAPINAVHQVQLGQTELKLRQDLAVARVQLEKKLGHLGYLKNLEKMKEAGEAMGNQEECPICKAALGHSWALLVCGHCYCCDCIHTLATRFGGGSQQIRCPVCRESTHKSNVSYVSARRQKEEESEDVDVKGSHSSKVEAVVRCLMNIRTKEPGAKCLVFSSWQEVLQIVSKALDENGVPQLFLRSNSQGGTVGKFRTSADFNILLLPVHSGANGLNLVEATHVILMEPLLNLAAEQQAIGRVHRIGQRQKTTVYRFLVRGTIEERIYSLMGEHSSNEPLMNQNQQENSITIAQLSELFR